MKTDDVALTSASNEETILTLRVLAGVSVACGCMFSTLILTGLDAGSTLWLWYAASTVVVALTLIVVARYLERVQGKS